MKQEGEGFQVDRVPLQCGQLQLKEYFSPNLFRTRIQEAERKEVGRAPAGWIIALSDCWTLNYPPNAFPNSRLGQLEEFSSPIVFFVWLLTPDN